MIETLDMDRINKEALNSGNYDKYIEDEIVNKINEMITDFRNHIHIYSYFPPNN